MLSILKKIVLAIFIVVIYFFVIRELRQELHNFYMGTLLPTEYGEINEEYFFYSQSSVSFTITSINETLSKGWQFKMPFDSYWMFGSFVLALIGATKKEYRNLSLIHLASGLVTLILVVIGIKGYDIFLILTDFICRYLIPLASLGYVSIIVGGNKSFLQSHVQAP
jgi:hypothetical protein